MLTTVPPFPPSPETISRNGETGPAGKNFMNQLLPCTSFRHHAIGALAKVTKKHGTVCLGGKA